MDYSSNIFGCKKWGKVCSCSVNSNNFANLLEFFFSKFLIFLNWKKKNLDAHRGCTQSIGEKKGYLENKIPQNPGLLSPS
jgi:hypothetical protein